MLYPSKSSFKSKGEIKTSPDKQKMEELKKKKENGRIHH